MPSLHKTPMPSYLRLLLQAGAPLDDMNVYLALQELMARFRYHQIDPTVVGPVDVAAALIRLEAVTRQHAIEVNDAYTQGSDNTV